MYVGDKPSLDLQQSLTFEAWVYPIDSGSDEPVFAKEGPGGKQSYWFGVYGGQFGLLLNDGSNGWSLDARHSSSITNYEWQHIASTWDGTTWKNYKNGVLVGQGTWANQIHNSDSPLIIGGNSEFATTKFGGIIDEARIWNVARSQSEIRSTMYHHLEGTESGLAAYWSFNEANGQIAQDSSPNGDEAQLGATTSAESSDPQWLTYGAPLRGDLTHRTGTIAGTIMSPAEAVDGDYFNLGTVNAGETVFLSVRLPGIGNLKPVVEFRDSTNSLLTIAPNPSSSVGRTDITRTGTYYAVIWGLGGQGPYGQYLLDVAIWPTGELEFADLGVSQIVTPTTASSGETIHVSWTVGNFGTGTTDVATWYDRLVISTNDKYGDGDDIYLTSVKRSGTLAVGDSYTAETDVKLPLGISGNYWIFVKTDETNAVFEYTFESNNIRQSDSQIVIALTDYADLEANSVSNPARGVVGESLSVTWTVHNNGIGTTGNGTPSGIVDSWIDRLVVSPNTIYGDADDRLLANVSHTGSLASGELYGGNWTGTLPTGLSGNYNIFVFTDVGNAVYEYTNTYSNLAVASGTINIAPAPFADLVVDNITAPASTVIGEQIHVTWSVTNTSNAWAATPVNEWYDSIVLSQDNICGNSDDRNLGQILHNGSLSIGDTYSGEGTVTIPSNVKGTYNLFVVVDAINQVYEFSYEGNNTSVRSQIQITTPDLMVDSVSAPANSEFGQNIDVTWTVSNHGNGSALKTWSDRLWLSTDNTPGGDWLLLTQSIDDKSPLAAGESYTKIASVSLPLNRALLNGTYYIIVQTDTLGEQAESNELNNTGVSQAIKLSLPPLPIFR